MGCGCGKRRRSKIVKSKATKKQRLAVRLAAASKQTKEKVKRKKLIEKKITFCKSCTYSASTKAERKRKIKVCHKASVSIQAILNKSTFKCPIGNF